MSKPYKNDVHSESHGDGLGIDGDAETGKTGDEVSHLCVCFLLNFISNMLILFK